MFISLSNILSSYIINLSTYLLIKQLTCVLTADILFKLLLISFSSFMRQLTLYLLISFSTFYQILPLHISRFRLFHFSPLLFSYPNLVENPVHSNLAFPYLQADNVSGGMVRISRSDWQIELVSCANVRCKVYFRVRALGKM